MAKIGGQTIPGKVLLLLSTELLWVGVGLTLAAVIRLSAAGAASEFSTAHTLGKVALVMVVCALALYYCDVYDLRGPVRRAVLFVSIMQALGLACLVLAVIYYMQPEVALGRGIAILAVPIIIALIVAWRLFINHVQSFTRHERLLILGTADSGIALAREICSRSDLNYKVVGFLDERGENIGKSLVNPGIIGAVANVQEIVAHRKPERIVLSLSERRGCMPVRDLLQLRMRGIQVEDAHTVYERITGRIMLDRLSPSWLILSDGFRKSNLLLRTKRLVDILVSAFALVVTFPICALVVVAIWLESGRPIFFRQSRMGFGGRDFIMLKFRSMRQDAERSGAKWAADNDPRVTWVGKWIRRSRIDEIPQFWNVLRGEMSLVGPRPEQPYFCNLLEQKLQFFSLRHTVRPGITGWAQIKYRYGCSIEDAKSKLELDLFYIKHLSIALDLAIIFETAKVMLLGRGAR